MSKTIYYTVAETAKMVRNTLKVEFPDVKFSVRSKSYSGGASITINWTDGPATNRVKDVVSIYEASTFDGMIDLKSSIYVYTEGGEKINYGSDYVFCERNISPELLDRIAEKVAKFWDVEKPTLNENGWYDYNANHVYLEDHNWDSIIDKIRQAMAWVEVDADNNLVCESDKYVHGLAQWLPSAIKGDGIMAHCNKRKQAEAEKQASIVEVEPIEIEVNELPSDIEIIIEDTQPAQTETATSHIQNTQQTVAIDIPKSLYDSLKAYAEKQNKSIDYIIAENLAQTLISRLV